jgi:hypothetical protein
LKPDQLATVNISPRRMEKFLIRWVNIGLPDDHANRLSSMVTVPTATYTDGANKLRQAYPNMFLSERGFKGDHLLINLPKGAAKPTEEQLDCAYVSTIAQFGRRLQIMWDSLDEERKHKRFVQLHYWVLKFFINPASDWTPEMLMEEQSGRSDPLDHLLAFLGDNLSRLKHCPRPGCSAPYFLASRGNGKFCGSTECANWGRQQAQNRYWNAKGSARRVANKAASKPNAAKKAKR